MPKDITIYDEESDRHVHIPFEQALHATTYGHPNGVTGDLFDLENLAAKGVDVKTPRPRKDWASKPCLPAAKAAGPDGPASGYVSFCSGASAMYSESCGGITSICEQRQEIAKSVV